MEKKKYLILEMNFFSLGESCILTSGVEANDFDGKDIDWNLGGGDL